LVRWGADFFNTFLKKADFNKNLFTAIKLKLLQIYFISFSKLDFLQ
jgi:hypothetical protein